MNNIDYQKLEERMAGIIVGMSKEESNRWREMLVYCHNDVTATILKDKCRSGMLIQGNSYDSIIQGNSYDSIILDNIVEEQPKKKPLPFYQTLNKQPKFVRNKQC